MTMFSDRQIFLIGSYALQNELLANFITKKTGASCTVLDALSDMPLETGAASQKRLILYDFSKSGETLEGLLASDTKNVLKTDYLVLINLSPTLNIEIEALQCGVRGFLYYQGGVNVLLKMIPAVLLSELWVSREVVSELVLNSGQKKAPKSTANKVPLSPREIDILKGIGTGLTNAMIADNHCLSPHTVKTHIYHIFKKINVSNRLQAAQWASTHL